VVFNVVKRGQGLNLDETSEKLADSTMVQRLVRSKKQQQQKMRAEPEFITSKSRVKPAQRKFIASNVGSIRPGRGAHDRNF
jgi:hypothetical protein